MIETVDDANTYVLGGTAPEGHPLGFPATLPLDPNVAKTISDGTLKHCLKNDIISAMKAKTPLQHLRVANSVSGLHCKL